MKCSNKSKIIPLALKLNHSEKFNIKSFKNIKNVSKVNNDIFDLNEYYTLYKMFLLSQQKYDNTIKTDDHNIKNYANNKLMSNYMYFLIDNRDIIGFIMIYPYKSENFVSIGELFVNPKYRHHGFATLLINYAKYLAINKYRVEFITIGVEKYNLMTYNMYTKLGFKEYKDWKTYSQENVINTNKILVS